MRSLDLFINSDSFYNCIYITLVKVQANYYNNILILDVKQLIKIMKLYYFHILKALWDDQGKIKIFYGMSRVKKQLSRKRSIEKILILMVIFYGNYRW